MKSYREKFYWYTYLKIRAGQLFPSKSNIALWEKHIAQQERTERLLELLTNYKK